MKILTVHIPKISANVQLFHTVQCGSDPVRLWTLQVCLAGPTNLPGNELADGPGLGELLPVPVEYRNLAKQSVGLVLRPVSKTNPEVLIINVTGC